MRLTVIVLNLGIVLFFGVFLAYTFVAKKHFEALARNYVIERTIAYADPLISSAQAQFEKPSFQILIPSQQKDAIRHEFADYRRKPERYIAQLTSQSTSTLGKRISPKILAKAVPFKGKVQEFYHETLAALLRDLRVFALSNLLAGTGALFLAFKSPLRVRSLLVWLSFLMIVAVCGCSYLYIDDLSFFRILMRSHMGWWYPSLLLLTTIRLFWNFWEAHEVVDEIDEAVNPTKVKTKPNS